LNDALSQNEGTGKGDSINRGAPFRRLAGLSRARRRACVGIQRWRLANSRRAVENYFVEVLRQVAKNVRVEAP
jgi:hypothetical protein